MKHELDMDKIAAGIGAQRAGKVKSSGGYFSAMQLAAEVSERLRVPTGGGRATDPTWTERRLIPLSPAMLKRLEDLADRFHVAPLQVASILLEKTLENLGDDEMRKLAQSTAG